MVRKMKFEIGEKVKIKSSGKIGEVKTYKKEVFWHNGKLNTVRKYYVYTDQYYNLWFDESDLDHYNSYKFEDKFEIELLNFLINVYFDHGKWDLCRQLAEEKKLYKG